MRIFTRLVRSGDKKAAQIFAQKVYDRTGDIRKDLESKGIVLTVSNSGGGAILDLPQPTNDWKFGYRALWAKIPPVAYKIHFARPNEEPEYVTEIVKRKNGERWITKENPKAKKAYWIFDRYQTYERVLDFPEVRPEFTCEKCGVRVKLNHLDDLFAFHHECIDPNNIPTMFWFNYRYGSAVHTGWSLNQLYRFIGRYLPSTGFGFSISSTAAPDEFWANKVMDVDEIDYENG